MRKEQIIAIFLGSLIGVGTAFFLWRLNKAGGPQDLPPEENIPVATTRANSVGFNIVAPQQNAVVNKESVEISGFSTPNTLITVISSSIALASSNSSGEFLVEVTLLEGINKLTILSFEKGQAPLETELTLFYTTELDLSDPQKNAKAVSGSITDIAEDTLQVRTSSGQIEQASLSDKTTFASNLNKATQIKFADLAIGDFVLVLGFANENVLATEHVLVTSEPESIKKIAKAGTIKTLSNKEFLVSLPSGEEVSVDAIGGVSTFALNEEGLADSKLSNAKENQEIVIIGEMAGQELVAERIILL